jgi:hypothetical protein
MMYALQRDVVIQSDVPHEYNSSVKYAANTPLTKLGELSDEELGSLAGKVTLRPDKRPRPLVLRMGSGDCMTIKLTNLLTPNANPLQTIEQRSNINFTLDINDQVAKREVSLRFQGTELVEDISDDGSYVGKNESSLVAVGASDTFHIRGLEDGAYVGTSYGQTTGGEGLGGQTASGLFAVLNVNARGAGFFRSQVTNEEMLLAAFVDPATGEPILTDDGRPGNPRARLDCQSLT